MNLNQRKAVSIILLIVSMIFLAIGISADNNLFSWIAIALVLISLVLGGRFARPRRRR